ncbi:glycosyltransferase family 2 protein [Agrococcus beijingensis]|uniref:glycosyltransferase family 2 protein n=1 Tax=Agrococcus beijingensis TaxID=3068634 RepID=UPI002740B6E1|nr:galactosyltransferase-related protein [Agrococcus sp. REN33]
MSRVAVITIAHGRHDHWALQCAAIERSSRRPDDRILVTMDDAALAHRERRAGAVQVVETDSDEHALPLARARNVGAEAALARGADVLVFLDVDCLPAPTLVDAYAAAASAAPTRDRLLSGPVTYLDPPPEGGYCLEGLAALDRPHTARPAPAPGEVELGGSHDLFWSLSFALSADLWRRIGGFHEGYVGYGGEDTDFAWTARSLRIPMAWVGDARVPPASPGRGSAGAPRRRHPAQQRALPPSLGHLADARMARRVRRAGARRTVGEWRVRAQSPGMSGRPAFDRGAARGRARASPAMFTAPGCTLRPIARRTPASAVLEDVEAGP